MNAAPAIPQGLGDLSIGEILTSLALPSKHAAKRRLSGSVEDAVRGVTGILDQMTLDLIEKRTREEFKRAFDESFPAYAQIMLGLSRIVTGVVPRPVIDQLTADCYCELESEFRGHALPAFGADIQEQAIFTVWTLRKITDLTQKIALAGNVAYELKEKDGEFLSKFVFHALRARFSLDCLTASMSSGRPIYPEALVEIADGLKSAVNAYAWIKQGYDLRMDFTEPVLDPVDWDEEDQALLDASMRDLAIDRD